MSDQDAELVELRAEVERLRALLFMGPCFICDEPVYSTARYVLKPESKAAHDSCFSGRVGPDEQRFQDKRADMKRRPDGSLYRG